ncbi:MAG TPA: hypothetical protein VGM27_24925 [Acidobacteriaceae bacterium]|jgi:hypothetical protein
MFGFGKRKSKLDDHQKIKLADGLADMLAMQMVFAKVDQPGVTKIEAKRGHINQKAIGYIYGFIDCALQSRREDTSDVSVSVPIVYYVMHRLFPGQEETYTDYLLGHANDEMVVLGMMKGGQQYSQFIARPGHKGVPMGLASFILDEQEKQSSKTAVR